MHHNAAAIPEKDNALKKKARLGVIFFFIYLFFYGGFVAIGVLNYELLSIQVMGGINLALFYGIGLIVFAVVLGVFYNFYCSRFEDELNPSEKQQNKEGAGL